MTAWIEPWIEHVFACHYFDPIQWEYTDSMSIVCQRDCLIGVGGLWVVSCGSWVPDPPCKHVMYTYFYAVSNALSQQRLCPRSLSSVYTEWLLRDCGKELTGVSTMTKATTARSLPGYKADAWRLILSFHEINKSWPNMKTKIPWDVC